MRPEEPFDPAHPRCRFPAFGKRFTQVMEKTGLRPPEIARGVGISPEIVRGYRRGFSHPSPTTKANLEKFLGETLDTPEATALPQALTLPATVTVERDPSGDLLLSIRLSPNQLAEFLQV